ncbi:DinI-like family protein [Escherichia coli]|uniref:DinI-like family protein n=1 Tax=Escherichia coli TaxID=562 RepID=UPI0030D1A6ED
MIRIEILFDRQSTKNLKSGTLQALQNEIEQRLKPHYPEIWLRIDQGSAPSVSVTGARNDKDKERILSLLEEIWQDDSWLPAARVPFITVRLTLQAMTVTCDRCLPIVARPVFLRLPLIMLSRNWI